MSDANVVGRWVTDAGDDRAGAFVCVGGSFHGEGVSRRLTAPFYEAYGSEGMTYCPACALAHFGVRPPGREPACGECGASPCDCNARIWECICRHRKTGETSWCNTLSGDMTPPAHGMRRADLLAFRDHVSAVYDFGPVQRITDPPYDFDATTKPATAVPPIEKRHGIYGGISTAPTLRPCSLPWCSAPAAATFCSPNCERAHEDRIAAVARREAFVHRMRERGKNGQPEGVGLIGEIAWSEQKTTEEIETIRRAWSALRHEAATGNEDAFASTGDEP